MDDDRTASLMTPAKLAQVKPKTPVAPAAWLNQMAADAGHAHVVRLAELRGELQAHAADRRLGPVTDPLAQLGAALPQLDFGLLQTKGWWARTTGKARTAGAEFGRQVEHIERAARELVAQVQALQTAGRTPRPGKDRAMLEFEVEYRAIDKIIDQGARWLEDMRNQIKVRKGVQLNAHGLQQVHDDTARCEILLVRLKALRRVGSSAHQAHQRAQAAAARAGTTLALLRQMVDADLKGWLARVSALAQAAAEAGHSASQVDAAMEAHRDLQLCVKQAMSDCTQTQAEEQSAADGLFELGIQVDSLHG
jgi:hypothetical protein